MKITPGKFRGLSMIADSDGRFTMLATDQRGSMQKGIAAALRVDKSSVKYDDIVKMKKAIIEILAPFSSGTLMDPEYGFPHSAVHIPKSVGILLALEESGYDLEGTERRSRLLEWWSVEKIKRAGADAVKIVIPYNHEASKGTLEYQRNFVRAVGKECEQHDIAFVFEPVSYPKDGADSDTTDFAKKRPEIVLETVQEFSKPEYKVDLLKIEFPADLKYTKEYVVAGFDGAIREPVYDLSQVKEFCRQVSAVAAHPWVILSAGVDIKEFIEQVKLAVSVGASGFLCGRAIWKKALGLYPDMAAVSEYLRGEASENFKKANAEVVGRALPWFDHKKFGGIKNIEIKGRGAEWYKNF